MSLNTFLESMHTRLVAVEGKLGLPSPATAPGIAAAGGGGSAALSAFDALLAEKLAPFVATSSSIGGKVEQLGKAVERVFQEERAILAMAADSKKPSDASFMANLNAAMADASKLKERDAFENHAKAVLDGLGCVTWVNPAIPTPGPFAADMAEASSLWMNKVRSEHKGKEGGDAHLQWCKELDALYKGLVAFVKAEQPTGVTWNAKGKDAGGAPPAAAAAAPAAASSSGGGKPPAAAAALNVFAELSKIDQSSGKTAGLKHVTKDMKSSANKDAPPVEPKKAPAPKKEEFNPKNKVFELQGNKWVVEGQTGSLEIPADKVDIKNSVYVFNCQNLVLQVPGKCNTITVDGCKNTQVVFQDVLAMVECVNSKGAKIFCKGKAPTVAVDKTDGVVITLSRDTYLETKIVASKSSEMNVQYPGKTDDDAWVERVIPEQYVHKITEDGKVTADVSDLYTHG